MYILVNKIKKILAIFYIINHIVKVFYFYEYAVYYFQILLKTIIKLL